jgi:hypothetical protein
MAAPQTLEDYVSESAIRQRVLDALQQRVHEDQMRAEAAKKDGAEYKRKYHMALHDLPEYQRWVDSHVAKAKEDGRLITERQYADLQEGRWLQEGDRARYLGPTTLQKTQSGKNYLRKEGETGTISQVLVGKDNVRQFWFLPDFPKNAADPHGPDVFIAQFHFMQGTPAYFLFERIPE